MKKFFLVLIISMFFLSCGGTAKQSEFWDHDTMYRNNDHLLFSWSGYKNPTPETLNKSQEQGWWGIEVK